MKDWSYQPATDIAVPPLEAFRSTRREKGFFSNASHAMAGAALWSYFRVYHRLRVVGKEKFPAEPPFVIVSNHTSHLDACALATALPPRARLSTYPVAAGDVFFTSLAMSMASSLIINALPLWRKKATAHAMEDLRERLLEGHCGLIIFPEGARARDGALQRFKPGIGMLVAGTGVPVYPCLVVGAYRALPPDARLPRARRVTVRVGDPLRFDATPNTRQGWESVAEAVRASVAALASPPK